MPGCRNVDAALHILAVKWHFGLNTGPMAGLDRLICLKIHRAPAMVLSMKSSDLTILITPGWNDSGPDHWQSRWASRLSTARRVEQADFSNPDCAAWADQLVEAVEASPLPVVVVAHSLGTTTLLHAAPRLSCGKGPGQLAGAFLVAPPDLEAQPENPLFASFAPVPMQRLGCPALVVASSTDPFCTYTRAETFAAAWGAEVVDAGEAGHINPEAGFGPWPEGTMRFLGFVKSL